MYHRILCMFFLISFSQGVSATCNVTVGLVGGDVEFNPFQPDETQLTLQVSHNGENHTNLTVKFDSPVAASTLNTYRPYVIENASNTTIFDSNDTATAFPFIDVARALTTGRQDYFIDVIPDIQAGNSTALGTLPSGSVTLPVTIDANDSGGVACSKTEQLTMNVSVPEERVIAVSNSFSAANTPLALNSVEVNNTLEAKSSTLYLWSNAKYHIQATSTNGGVMVRSGVGVDTTKAVNKLPYTLQFGTSTQFTLSSGDTTVASVEEDATVVNGKQIAITFTPQDTGQRAGTYTDTVKVKITPPL